MMVAMLIWTGSLRAQSEEQIEKFKQEREAYFNEKLDLTDAEAKAFWPVYNDYQNRKTKHHEEERNTYRYCNDNAANMSDEEIVETLDKILGIRSEMCELEQEYYGNKFQKVLPPKKVLMLNKVEMDFRRYLMREIRRRGQGSEGGQGRRQGRRPDHDTPQ